MLGTLLVIGVALAIGYSLVVALSLMATMAIASAARGFVVREYCFRPAYKLLMALFWTVTAGIAGFLVALIAGPGAVGWAAALALAAVLILVLWTNSWEARQRGLPHQILLTLLTALGVLAGAYLRLH